MDEAPLATGSHGISIFFAQESEPIGQLGQILDADRVSLELLVETRHGASVLDAPEQELLFSLPLALLINAGQRRGEADQQHRGCHHNDEKRKAAAHRSGGSPAPAGTPPVNRAMPANRQSDSHWSGNDATRRRLTAARANQPSDGW